MNYNNQLRSLLMDEWISFRRLLELYILPNTNKDVTECYDIKTKEFNGEYIWYLASLNRIKSLTHRVYEMTDSLLIDLKDQLFYLTETHIVT